MTLSRSSLAVALPVALVSLLFTAGCGTSSSSPTPPPTTSTAVAATTPTVNAADLRQLNYAGDQGAWLAIDREIASAGQSPAKLQPIAARLVAVLRDRSATFAAKQAAAQRLSLFPASDLLTGNNRAAFAALLLDEQQVNLARLALDRVPGAEVDGLFAEALPRARGFPRLALTESVGNRRIAAATATLATALDDADPALAAAAAKALGQIGSPESLTALEQAKTASNAVLEAEFAAASQLPAADALTVYQNLAGRADAPAGLRAAATRAQLFVAANAAERLTSVLAGRDALAKSAAIEAITTLPADQAVPALSAQLPSLDAGAQAAVITSLGQTGATAAITPVATAVRSDAPSVRSAAITALGRLPGNPDTVMLLAQVAAGDNAADAKLARQSLSVLTGAGVADIIVTQAKSGPATLRGVFIEQLAARNMTDQVPLLLQFRSDADPAVRSAALGSLADIAPPSVQPELIAWTIGATSPTEQSRALRALALVTLRNPSATERSRAIISALEQAEPAVAVRLLPVLSRIGDQPAADCAARLALLDHPTEAAAAASVLARWPNDTGLPPLVSVAEQAKAAPTRASASAAALRMLERSRSLPGAQLRGFVQRLLATSTDADTRSRLVYLLGRASDADTLAYAEQLRSDAALTGAATDAVMAIKAAQSGRPIVHASVGERFASVILDGKPNTVWGAPATAGQWLEIDFHATRPIRRLVFDNGEFNYPEHAEVFVTDDLANPGPALASVGGQPNKTTIELPKVAHGRYLIIRHTQTREDSWWGMSELLID